MNWSRPSVGATKRSGFKVAGINCCCSRTRASGYRRIDVGHARTPAIDVRAIKLITTQIKSVRCRLLWTNIDEACCKYVGRLLNSSAITKIDDATRISVVISKDNRRTVQLERKNSMSFDRGNFKEVSRNEYNY